jgi:hypothetical protein
MKRVYEGIRIEPLMLNYGTAAATSNNKINVARNANFSVLVGHYMGASCVNYSTIADLRSATVANTVEFSLTEATAASANGSVITGATLTLGAATAFQCRSLPMALINVSSALSTDEVLTINGINYNTTAVGATGTIGGPIRLAAMINGSGSAQKLPHYTAIPFYMASTDGVGIVPDDDLGTGLTISATAASTFNIYMRHLQGAIEVAGHRLSTNTPKYIGVNVGVANDLTTGVSYAFLMRKPTGSPAFVGSIMDVTT